jgi:hypothetical protein
MCLITRKMLRDGGDVFLDDTRIEDLDNAFPNQHFLWIEPTAAALHQAIFQPKQRSKRKKDDGRMSISYGSYCSDCRRPMWGSLPCLTFDRTAFSDC